MEKNVSPGNNHKLPKVSIVTACYKSVSFLERVYQSIKIQDYPNIEWIAVDDLSPDDTLARLEELKDRKEIDVTVLPLQKNTLGFGAIKAGIGRASGQFTIILDHDDELMPGIISRLVDLWYAHATTGERLFGIWGRCVNEKNELLGKLYPQLPMICSNDYFFHTLKCRAECFLMCETALLKDYYTLNEGEVLKTNGAIWNEMGKTYRSIFTNEIARRYYTNVPGSHSTQKKTRTPLAFAIQEAAYLNNNYRFFKNDAGFFLKKIILYSAYSHYAGSGIRGSLKRLDYAGLKFLTVLLLPALPLLLLRDRLR